MRMKMPFSSRGVARVENRGKIIFKWAQAQERALTMYFLKETCPANRTPLFMLVSFYNNANSVLSCLVKVA